MFSLYEKHHQKRPSAPYNCDNSQAVTGNFQYSFTNKKKQHFSNRAEIQAQILSKMGNHQASIF